ncbi:hypothetical protein [Nocardioides sp. LHG3406-4]|uniref:hypothetical protein n=1 Tax=Nocardioides sp. LHG3406-4 TaxID=2804575 RepID=UPI003CEEDA00
MEAGLGVELPQRTPFVWALVAMAALFAVPCVRMVAAAAGEHGSAALGGWAMAVVMTLVVVVLPLFLARHIQQRHTYVSEEAVTWVQGDEVRRRMRFADVEEVRVRFGGPGGFDWLNEKVYLIGTLGDGSRGHVIVNRVFNTTIQPVLQRLAVEVERRPALLADDTERAFFADALTQAD